MFLPRVIRIAHKSTGTQNVSDSMAMAWRARASLVNLEMQWWHTSDVAHPPTWQRMQILPNPLLGSPNSARGELRPAKFFNQQVDDPMAFGPYTVQLKALVKQVRQGKASYEGGYFAGFDHMDPGSGGLLRPTPNQTHQSAALDPATQLLETAVSAHYRQGGVLVDTDNMRSTVAGLYIAGGLGGLATGWASRSTFDGKSAADVVSRPVSFTLEVGAAPKSRLHWSGADESAVYRKTAMATVSPRPIRH